MNHKKTPLHFNPLHIFRAILRETTYHPDPRARFYLKHHTRDSFRINKIKFAIHRQPWDPADKRKREVALMRRARHFCSVLRRANEGYLEPFRRTLSLTYARTGARRRQIMARIMAPVREPAAHGGTNETGEIDANTPDEPPLPASSDHASLSPPAGTKKSGVLFPMGLSDNRFFPEEAASSPPIVESSVSQVVAHRASRPPKTAPPLFTALSTSQSSASAFIPSQTRTNKSHITKLPTTTIWNRPLPACRLRNLTAKWYANEASILMPPLPSQEWAHIRSIAAGHTHLTPSPRRPPAKTRVFGPAPDPAEQAASLLALPEREAGYEGKQRGNPHRMTSRFFRREYEWLLRHVPLQIETSARAPAREADAKAGPEGGPSQHNPPKQRKKADKPAFLWHSSILERAGRRMSVQSLGAEATKALFD